MISPWCAAQDQTLEAHYLAAVVRVPGTHYRAGGQGAGRISRRSTQNFVTTELPNSVAYVPLGGGRLGGVEHRRLLRLLTALLLDGGMTFIRGEDFVEGNRQLRNVTRVDRTGVELDDQCSQ